MTDHDELFLAVIQTRDIAARTEAKVDAMSTQEGRIQVLEGKMNMVMGMVYFIGVLWTLFVAWVAGIGGWVRDHLL